MKVVSRKYEDFVEADFDRYVQWHRNALDKPPHLYEVLRDLLTAESDTGSGGRLLNLCAGNGNLIHFLAQSRPDWKYIGVDTVDRLIDDESSARVRRENISLEHVDSYADVGSRWSGRFDATVHWMRLLHFDDWQTHLDAAIKATRKGGHVFVASLFNTYNVDLMTVVHDWNQQACRDGYGLQYNTFSAKQVLRFCEQQSVAKAEFTDFEIPFDIPRKSSGFGTYTVKTAAGRRLQISAGLLMNWKILHLIV